MTIDYAELQEGMDFLPSWQDFFDLSFTLPENLLNLVRRSIVLPNNFYDIIAVYALLPSALAKIVPYLFLYGTSGSGKSTVGKLIANLHNIHIHSSVDTFASIRNDLEQRKWKRVTVFGETPNDPAFTKDVEQNTFMVWDDLDPSVFDKRPDIFRLFKFGYDRASDTISISSSEPGKNIRFRCFCPKVFSSIHPIHLVPDLLELRRRLLVIKTKRLEDFSQSDRVHAGLTTDFHQPDLIDLNSIEWSGFSDHFKQYWEVSRAKYYLGLTE